MLDRFRWKMQNFMMGRNGFDTLNRCLFVIALILDIVGLFAKNNWIDSLALAFIVWLLFRFFSRDISRRQYENSRFVGFFQLIKTKFLLRREYKVFQCKKCHRTIRVPKHHGRVEVTCPLCGDKIQIETGRKK